MAKTEMHVTVALSNGKVADLLEQTLLAPRRAGELKPPPEYKQGFEDGVAAVIRFLRAIERDSAERILTAEQTARTTDALVRVLEDAERCGSLDHLKRQFAKFVR